MRAALVLHLSMGDGPIEILLNGERRVLDRDPTIAQLLRELGLDPRGVAVERNLEIVARAHYDTTALCDGDRLEVVTFVGGG
jgi:thiamine biosynthesis protein ThiS